MKDLKELALSYYRGADIVAQRIAERRRRLKKLGKGSREAGILRDELNVLYRERRDTLETADLLWNYYGGDRHAQVH